MNTDILLFFEGHLGALPLYEKLEAQIREEIGQVDVKVQKSQISFYCKRLFACVSFMAIRKKRERPEQYIVVTFGLGHKVISPRIQVATEPYPNRWTHHLLISQPEEIDEELMGWLQEAAEFARKK